MNRWIALALTALATSAMARTMVSAGNDFYTVSADLDRNGAYTVGTGPNHPVTLQEGVPSNVLRGGFNNFSGISFGAIRSYLSGTDYYMGMPGYIWSTDAGHDCVYISDVTSPEVEMLDDGSRDVGFILRWVINRPPDHFVVEERLAARGTDFTSAAAEITLGITNLGPTDASLGLRYVWSLALGNTGGAGAPTIGPQPPEPPAEPFFNVEQDLAMPAFRSYVVSNEDRPSNPGPIDDNPYVIEATVGGIPLEPAPTRPDRFLLTLFGQAMPFNPATFGALNSCFGYDIAAPPRAVYRASGTGVVYFWGETPSTARVVHTGETTAVTQYIFAYLDFPLTCDAGAPRIIECAGPTTSVELDGSASDNRTGEGIEFLWSATDSAVRLDDPTAAQPVATIAGLGRHEITLLAHRGPFATGCMTEVEVVDTTPPSIGSARALPSILWPPSHRLVPIHVDLDVTDSCDDAASVRLIDATSSEPEDVRRGGDGHTTRDIQLAEIGTDDRDVLLRSEREGAGPGRVYTLLYEVTDSSGNSVRVPVVVTVPHDMSARRSRR